MLKSIGLIFILLGSLLICSNTIGLYYFRTVEPDDPFVTNRETRKLSESQFWDIIDRNKAGNIRQYAETLTRAISERILFVAPENLKSLRPNFFENWIVWMYSLRSSAYQWIDTGRAVRLGGGMCSQCAILFNRLMEERGYPSVILRLNGHVLNEVLIDGKLLVYDADYNIVFNKQLNELERDPNFLYSTYLSRGASDQEARAFTQAFINAEDNIRMRYADKYAAAGTMQDIVEPVSFYLIWLIPVLLILIGLKMYSAHSQPDHR